MTFAISILPLILGETLFFHAAGLNSLEDVFFGLESPRIVGGLASPLISWLSVFTPLVAGLISFITSILAGRIVTEGLTSIHPPFWKRCLLAQTVTLVPTPIIGFVVNLNEEQSGQLIICV